MENFKKDVIIACDFSCKKELFSFLEKFNDEQPFLKIGMELFYKYGPNIVKEIKSLGFKIFLDLKLYDIPNTVLRSISNLVDLEVEFISVHALGTKEMLKSAKLAVKESGTMLLAVTILTSITEDCLRNEILINKNLKETVNHYSNIAFEVGIDGVVCSPLEAKTIKDKFKNKLLCVTPGIRYPDLTKKDDQMRIASPLDAKYLGSDFIVVGRTVVKSSNPFETYKKIKEEFLN